MNKKKKYWIFRHKWLFVLALIVVVCVFACGMGNKAKAAKKYVTVDVTRGNISQTVTATGEIMPVNTVNVGSQVSGTIEELYVDYNSKVKQGDLLLKIEPSVLQASVAEAEASLESAKSQLSLAQSEYERNKTLYDSDYISRAEMEKALSTYEQAVQSVKRMQSQYDRAVTNLGYATITSPVDGTVISRKVDKGQTVAASFQTPDLFEIAEDLTKMQIETSVSEADIGVIKDGQMVTFTVDAYPKQTFEGSVRQIRLSPTMTSNVVVYTVVIDVDNSDLRLMPGMTAFVTIIIKAAKNTWKAQNSGFLLRSFDGIVDTKGMNVKPDTHLAVKRGNDIVFVKYSKGLVTATETQIISDEIKEGDKIIVGYVGQESKSKSSTKRNGGMGGPGGAPGGGRR
ncbi:MAG: efflux RND transporter periplasmic adaptor subunit [Alphaproteobacteria bacterium]|nr:efflux RND transporter periplasmic adaptor subunit [Alphaproteobacteria bacterium]